MILYHPFQLMFLLNISFPFMRNSPVGILLSIETRAHRRCGQRSIFWGQNRKNNGYLTVFLGGSCLLFLEPDLDMMTNVTITHATVIVILFLSVATAVRTFHNLDIWQVPPQTDPLELDADVPGLQNLPFSCNPASTQRNELGKHS